MNNLVQLQKKYKSTHINIEKSPAGQSEDFLYRINYKISKLFRELRVYRELSDKDSLLT